MSYDPACQPDGDLRGAGKVLVGIWSMDPMDADIVMSRESDAGDVDCNVEEYYPCWRWLSRLGRSRNANGRLADVNVTRKKRKTVTFALDWDEKYEAVLCQRCRDHMKKHYHGELCGRCGAIFTINRRWSLPELNTHHGVAHACVQRVPLACHPAGTILILDPCKLGLRNWSRLPRV